MSRDIVEWGTILRGQYSICWLKKDLSKVHGTLNISFNICFIKIRSKHNDNTLLSLLRIFMKQALEGRIKNDIFVLDFISNKDKVIREDLLSSRTFQHMHGKAIWLSLSNICILQKKKKSNSTSDLEILHSQIPTFKQGLVWTRYKNKNISSNYIHVFFMHTMELYIYRMKNIQYAIKSYL